MPPFYFIKSPALLTSSSAQSSSSSSSSSLPSSSSSSSSSSSLPLHYQAYHMIPALNTQNFQKLEEIVAPPLAGSSIASNLSPQVIGYIASPLNSIGGFSANALQKTHFQYLVPSLLAPPPNNEPSNPAAGSGNSHQQTKMEAVQATTIAQGLPAGVALQQLSSQCQAFVLKSPVSLGNAQSSNLQQQQQQQQQQQIVQKIQATNQSRLHQQQQQQQQQVHVVFQQNNVAQQQQQQQPAKFHPQQQLINQTTNQMQGQQILANHQQQLNKAANQQHSALRHSQSQQAAILTPVQFLLFNQQQGNLTALPPTSPITAGVGGASGFKLPNQNQAIVLSPAASIDNYLNNVPSSSSSSVFCYPIVIGSHSNGNGANKSSLPSIGSNAKLSTNESTATFCSSSADKRAMATSSSQVNFLRGESCYITITGLPSIFTQTKVRTTLASIPVATETKPGDG